MDKLVLLQSDEHTETRFAGRKATGLHLITERTIDTIVWHFHVDLYHCLPPKNRMSAHWLAFNPAHHFLITCSQVFWAYVNTSGSAFQAPFEAM